MGFAVAALGALWPVAVAAAPVAGAAAGVYAVIEGERRAKKAESAAEAMAQKQWESMERRAGEHFDLTAEQMELQAQQANIMTLADVLTSKPRVSPAPAPQMFTIPPAKAYGAFGRINQAIDDIVRAA